MKEALKLSLKIIQFSLANMDGSVKGWPEEEIRKLGELVAANEELEPVDREVGVAFQQFAAPTIYMPTVQRPEKKSWWPFRRS